jgi:hypothetical protein
MQNGHRAPTTCHSPRNAQRGDNSDETAALQAENAALRARVQVLEARQAKDEHATPAGQQRAGKAKYELFDFLPPSSRPIARVGFACFGLGTVLFGVIFLLAFVFPQWIGPDSAVMVALLIAAAIGWCGAMLCIIVIGFKMT